MKDRNLKRAVLLMLLIATNFMFSQSYLLKNEKLLYSFETTNGKKLVLAKDVNNKYIIYRFGTKNKIEFEFPEKNKDSWKKFKYSFYFRGGGIQNEGLDLNYITFSNQEYDYIIYDTYSATENETTLGIKVRNTTSNRVIDIKGKTKSKKGTLVDFRDNNLLEIEEEIEFE